MSQSGHSNKVAASQSSTTVPSEKVISHLEIVVVVM